MDGITKFDNWNKLKQKLSKKNNIIKFSKGDIYFMSIGQNIGYEQYGKGKEFLRPVLVYKKLSRETFIGIPLTSKVKKGSYYFNFKYKINTISTAMLNQIRVFDIRRHKYFDGKINHKLFDKLELQVKEFMEVTPSKKEDWHQGQKSTKIISKDKEKVKCTIEGITLTPLKQIYHPKGDIFHGMKKSDDGFCDFGEAYFSTINRNDIKGWKKHTKMTLNIVVATGEIEFVVYNEETDKFFDIKLSQKNYQRLTIKPGLWVAFRGCDENNMLLNLASIEHDPSEAVNINLNEIKYEW
jgi:dTDP-4-dehydrorhamnose 3,5-epimerase